MSGEAVLVVEHEEPSRDFLARQLTDDGFANVVPAAESRARVAWVWPRNGRAATG
jgi:hypothetical protein